MSVFEYLTKKFFFISFKKDENFNIPSGIQNLTSRFIVNPLTLCTTLLGLGISFGKETTEGSA